MKQLNDPVVKEYLLQQPEVIASFPSPTDTFGDNSFEAVFGYDCFCKLYLVGRLQGYFTQALRHYVRFFAHFLLLIVEQQLERQAVPL